MLLHCIFTVIRIQ